MSVLWQCDRCSIKNTDNGAMVSYPPDSWQAYQLVKIESTLPHQHTAIQVSHVCNHCKLAISQSNKQVRIKFD